MLASHLIGTTTLYSRCVSSICRAVLSLVGLGSVSSYLLAHARLPVAVMRHDTTWTAPLSEVTPTFCGTTIQSMR